MHYVLYFFVHTILFEELYLNYAFLIQLNMLNLYVMLVYVYSVAHYGGYYVKSENFFNRLTEMDKIFRRSAQRM